MIGMLGMFLLGLAVVVFFVVYQRRLLRQQELNQQIKEEYQKDLLRATVDSREKERHRIAESLHDEIGALLTTSKLHLGQIKPSSAQNTVEERVQSSLDIISETIQSVRQISHDLKPPVLESLGLVAAIRSLIGKVAGEVTVSCDGPEGLTIPPDESLGCYRIIQELLQNALKHAQATEIHFDIRQSGRSLIIDYRDNGVGFDIARLNGKDAGLGLRNIESRLNLMEGHMEKVDNDAPGTHLIIKTYSQNDSDDY